MRRKGSGGLGLQGDFVDVTIVMEAPDSIVSIKSRC